MSDSELRKFLIDELNSLRRLTEANPEFENAHALLSITINELQDPNSLTRSKQKSDSSTPPLEDL